MTIGDSVDFEGICRRLNGRYNLNIDLSDIVYAVSPLDDMYVSGSESQSIKNEHYVNVGLSGLNCITYGLSSVGVSIEPNWTILDFPCGFGRVMRFIRAYFPQAELYGCDIVPEALEFVKLKFFANVIAGQRDFKQMNLMRKYDLIWCGSLFTHIDPQRFIDLLSLLWGSCEDGGVLVFTSHGRKIRRLFEEGKANYIAKEKLSGLFTDFDSLGYGYAEYPFMKDYGISLIKPSWVMRYLEELDGLERFSMVEHLYDDLQDVFSLKKIK